MSVANHVTYMLRNATLNEWPYPHFFVENVFPPDFYAEIQQYLRSNAEYAGTDYANRQFAANSIIPGTEFMKSPHFLQAVLSIFQPYIKSMYEGRKIQVYRDLRLIRDSQNYKIGPHTDARWKLVSLLFYLPPDTWHRDYGTSIFVPKDGKFTCEGGPHYPFEPFDKVWTAPFVPNSCLGFLKTSHSFHGVEPIPVEIRRDVLLFNIYQKEAFDASHENMPEVPATETS